MKKKVVSLLLVTTMVVFKTDMYQIINTVDGSVKI